MPKPPACLSELNPATNLPGAWPIVVRKVPVVSKIAAQRLQNGVELYLGVRAPRTTAGQCSHP